MTPSSWNFTMNNHRNSRSRVPSAKRVNPKAAIQATKNVAANSRAT